MQCYCCGSEQPLCRKVKLREVRDCPVNPKGPDDPAYQFYKREMTYRWAVVCMNRYRGVDSVDGTAEIGVKTFNIAGASRGDKAANMTEAKYAAWQRKLAEDMGLSEDE